MTIVLPPLTWLRTSEGRVKNDHSVWTSCSRFPFSSGLGGCYISAGAASSRPVDRRCMCAGRRASKSNPRRTNRDGDYAVELYGHAADLDRNHKPCSCWQSCATSFCLAICHRAACARKQRLYSCCGCSDHGATITSARISGGFAVIATEDEIRERLQRECVEAGSQYRWAWKHQVGYCTVNAFLTGKRRLGWSMERAMKLKRVWIKL